RTQHVRRLLQLRVDVQLRREAQGREPCGGGDGVPRQGARLVDRSGRGEVLHEVAAAAERGGREAAAHDLAEREEVRGAVRVPVARLLVAVPPGGGHAE